MKEFFKTIAIYDQKISTSILLWRNSFTTFVLKGFTESARGYLWVVYVVLLNLLIWTHTNVLQEQVLFLKAMFAPLLAWGLGKAIKIYFKRKRPYQAMKNFTALTHSPLDDSFPSLHAASSFSFACALFLLHHPYAPYALVWAPIVAFSRLYLGVHYLSDLIGGIAVGILSGTLIYFCIG